MNTPFPRSYWVVPGKLLAGYYPGALDQAEADGKLSALLDAGVQVAVNLMQADETDWDGVPFAPYAPRLQELGRARGVEVDAHRFAITDGGVPTRQQMTDTLDMIDGALAARRTVYVHCWGGKGRTGTVVGCYLARHGVALGQEALQMISELRRNEPRAHEPSPETKAQRELVASWRVGL